MEVTGVKLDLMKWNVIMLTDGNSLVGQVENGDMRRDFERFCKRTEERMNTECQNVVIHSIRQTDIGRPRKCGTQEDNFS